MADIYDKIKLIGANIKNPGNTVKPAGTKRQIEDTRHTFAVKKQRMKFILIPAVLFAVSVFGHAQCPELQLADLQNLQRTDPALKESKIQDLGFDLRSEFQNRGARTLGYSKCWNAIIRDKPVFEQLLWWNTDVNSLSFLTLNESHFLQLRRSIVERGAQGGVTENPDIYVGHLFLYRFGVRKVDDVEFFIVTIEFKKK